MTERRNKLTNDALQSREDDPAFGATAEDFGAGGQTVTNAGTREPARDPNRDPKLAEAGEKASAKGRRTPAPGAKRD